MRERHPLHPRYVVADLFSGCGGLSLGFSRTRRFDVALGCDIKPEALDTFIRNHEGEEGPPVGILEDIRLLKEGTVEKALQRYGAHRRGALDCLIGGPPCEGFSQNRSLGAGGKASTGASTRVGKFIDDPRNKLFRWFVELAAHLQPAVVLIENVPDLVRHRDGETREEIIASLAQAGYSVTVRVLNAADFGVPQMRRRAFFLCQRTEDLKRTGQRLRLPDVTHVPYPLLSDELDRDPEWLPGDSGYWTTVREAIGDLPVAASDDDFDHAARGYPMGPNSSLRRFLRSTDGAAPYNHIARKLGKSGLAKVRAIEEQERTNTRPPSRERDHYHYSYTRLRWGEPARTVTKFAYHVGSGMFAHPEEERAVTMREAARLQTFPDDFRFYSDNIRELSAMVGSAVPPLLAYAIGKQVVRYLDAVRLQSLGKDSVAMVREQSTDAVLKRLEAFEWGTHRAEDEQLSMEMSSTANGRRRS